MPRAKRRCSKYPQCKLFQPCPVKSHQRGWASYQATIPLPRDWPKRVREAKKRANGCCQVCGRKTCGSCPAAIKCGLDHIIPRADGGGHDASNTQWLCHGCHTAKTESDNRNRRKNK